MQTIIEVKDGITGNPAHRMASPVNLRINEGEQIAIAGPNAAGKSRLVDILTGSHPLVGDAIHFDFAPSEKPLVSDNIRYITFRDSYGAFDDNYFLQQRWNQLEIDDDTPTVNQLLELTCLRLGLDIKKTLRDELFDLFQLRPLKDRLIISLSSGELRKFQLTRALISQPRVLIIDNPYIGLDSNTRRELTDVLTKLTRETQTLVILVVSRLEDIPDFVTHVIPVENLQVMPKQTRREYFQMQLSRRNLAVSRRNTERFVLHNSASRINTLIQSIEPKDISSESFYPQEGGAILTFRNVSISYGAHTILKDLSWQVNEGERRAVYGANGSGKSTLLSLVCADNPQAYACDIELFGHARGSGESIWEIKRHIGYVSPEMHRAYNKDLPAANIVASGLFDTIGLYRRPQPEQLDICLTWMELFGIRHLAEKTFLQLSSGEQRMCLLARAFVKDPELLILDEPLHGLDAQRRALVRDIIEAFCRRPHKTLIMVTHYLEELPSCINQKLFLQKD